jgi:hypothetical protein
MTDSRRITLVGRKPGAESREWLIGPHSASRVIFINAFTVLQYALDHGIHDLQQDVERVVIDRGMAAAAHYLEFIAALPYTFAGDVLFVRSDGSAFLNAAAAHGNRVTHQLTRTDVDFYLHTNSLIADEMNVVLAA